MHACAHPYAQLIPVRGLQTVAAGPPGKGCSSLGGTKLAQEREEATVTLSAAWVSPPGLQQTGLNRPSYQLSPLCPTRLSWAQCWESGPQPFARDSTGPGWGNGGGGCLPRGQAGVGVSGECVGPGLGPRSCSAADLLWGFKE